MGDAGLRAWGGRFATGLAFPLAAVAAALLVFTTSHVTVGLVLGLVAALVPWALLAGDVRIGPWAMVAGGIGIPAVVAIACDAPGAIFLALLAMAWIAAGGRSFAAEVTAVIGAIAIEVVNVAGDLSQEREAVVYFATGALLTWLVGRTLRRERELVAALTDAQDRLHDAAAAAERQRIAHDVHDAIGHSLTVVLLNVAGARRVLSSDPAAAAEALDRAEQVGRESLQGVREIVGLLRAPGEAGVQPPQPGVSDIVGLVETAAAAGLPVTAEVVGSLDDVEPYAGLAAFRLVQEAISNVEHHAPAAQVTVRVVAEDDDRLTVTVRNGPARQPRPATAGRGGTGLDGMRQRLAALGGTVAAGPDGDGWLVEGSIPLRRVTT
jgi:signal transduction histidine kinase